MSRAQSDGALDEGLAREHLGRGLLEVVEHALAALVEAEDTVPRPLLERGRLGEAEDGRALVRDRGRVEVDHRVPGRDHDLAPAPGVLEEEAELHVEHDRGQESARGDRQRREELPLRRVAGEPSALAARVDEQDALRAEERARVPAPRLEQPVQGPQRAATGADPPGRRVGDDFEGELPRVEPLLAAALDERPEGRGLPLRGGRDQDRVEEAHRVPGRRCPALAAQRETAAASTWLAIQG